MHVLARFWLFYFRSPIVPNILAFPGRFALGYTKRTATTTGVENGH
jgi:hypothetical protein